jgi:hypothetical protein
VRPKLQGSFRLFRGSVGMICRHWRLFVGVIVVYGILNVLLVQSFSGIGNFASTKGQMDQAFQGGFNKFMTSASLFAYLLTTSGNTPSDVAGAYQMMLTIMTSLALIWLLRELYAKPKNKVRIRDGFYRGMYPLVPFMMVLAVVALQLLPLVIGTWFYNTVTTNGIAATFIEKVLWFTVFVLFAIWSLYMLSSSLFALYVVCLPDMAPLRALRSARELVRFRRLNVLRRVLFLPLALLVLAAILFVPLIWLAPAAAPWVFLVAGMALLPIVHSYLYRLYRELLR